MIRHIFATEKQPEGFSEALEKQEKLAKKMGHSLKEQQKTYVKKD